MKIRSKLLFIATLPAVAGMVLFGLQFWGNQQLSYASLTQEHLQRIHRSVFDLSVLHQDTLVDEAATRATQQWNVRYDTLGKQLQDDDIQLINAVEIANIEKSYQKLGDVAETYYAIHINGSTPGNVSKSLKEKRSLLRVQLNKTLQDMLSISDRMVLQMRQVAQQTRQTVLLWTIGGLAGIIFSMVALTWSVGRNIMAPILTVRNGMAVISAGNLDHKVGLTSYDEVGELSRDVDLMIEKLKDTMASREELWQEIKRRHEAEAEVRELNSSLERKVLQRTQELEDSNMLLSQANTELESFAYSVSHDLRAPLRAVDGYSQALMEDYGDKFDGDAKTYLNFLREGAQEMGRLIDAILVLSRSTRGDMVITEIDLSRLAETVAQEIVDDEPERAPCFKIQANMTAHADERLMKAVLENLLGNAWKYTSKTDVARIDFGSQVIDGVTTYCVQDNGAGFDMAYADKLFKPFQRLHSSSEFSGTGIGLSTVQRIIARHGGRIWGEGEIGKGATFYFVLREQENV